MPRKRDIEAAIAAYNDADDGLLLPPDAGRLLAVMFPRGDVCRRSEAELAARGFDRTALRRLLRALIEAGLLSRERGHGANAINLYRLHLPPQVQP